MLFTNDDASDGWCRGLLGPAPRALRVLSLVTLGYFFTKVATPAVLEPTIGAHSTGCKGAATAASDVRRRAQRRRRAPVGLLRAVLTSQVFQVSGQNAAWVQSQLVSAISVV